MQTHVLKFKNSFVTLALSKMYIKLNLLCELGRCIKVFAWSGYKLTVLIKLWNIFIHVVRMYPIILIRRVISLTSLSILTQANGVKNTQTLQVTHFTLASE